MKNTYEKNGLLIKIINEDKINPITDEIILKEYDDNFWFSITKKKK